MWITTIEGHCSAVKDNTKPGFMRLRFRDPKHAARFAGIAKQVSYAKRATKVEETPDADYRWKFSVPQGVWLDMLQVLGEQAGEYDNFKGACHHSPMMQDHSTALYRCWDAWHQVQMGLTPRPAPSMDQMQNQAKRTPRQSREWIMPEDWTLDADGK